MALNTGMILKDMLRHESLAKSLVYSERCIHPSSVQTTRLIMMGNRFYDFIDYIEQTTFGIACDAQANFKAS